MSGVEGLKPCPFCGNDARTSTYETESLWSHEQVTYTKVFCDECDVGFSTEPGYELEAPEAWNRRAPVEGGVRELVERAFAPLRSEDDERYGNVVNGTLDEATDAVCAALSAIEGGGGSSAAPIPTEREADSGYQWEAKLLDGQWRVGLKGNLDTVHDAAITVHKHGEGDIDQHIAEWVAEVHNAELTPSAPTEQADGGVVDDEPVMERIAHLLRDHRDAYVTSEYDRGRAHEIARLLATPPATPIAGGFGSSSPKSEDTHRVAETAVVAVPRDQLETLRRSLELGNLLPGEGETLINCWIFASEAESKA